MSATTPATIGALMNTLISRLRSRPITSLIGVVALLLAGMFGVIAWVSSGSVSGAVDTHEVVNTAGQYRFEAPTGWSTTQQGRTTTVTSPDVHVIPPAAKQVGPQPALIYGGIGNNLQNTQIRFLAITVQSTPNNYAIAVFTAAGSDPTVVLPPVNRVVDSFRALPKR
jgi:hypothetical protein